MMNMHFQYGTKIISGNRSVFDLMTSQSQGRQILVGILPSNISVSVLSNQLSQCLAIQVRIQRGFGES